MVGADSSTNLCSKCSGPLTFEPRINVDLDPDDSFTCSPLGMREMIPLCNEDLDDYDAEITRLQSQITHAQAQRKRLIHYRTRIQFLLSSFHRFPNEVLCLIFESTCTENLLQECPWPSASHFINYLPALAISSVCTRWRFLALASPTLWSQIRLELSLDKHPDSYHPVLDGHFMRTVQLYLDRSVDTPLAITLETWPSAYNDSPALELLLDHTYRWKTFTYNGSNELDQLLGFDHSFPVLETVTLDPPEKGHSERGEIACFENAPNLHSITTTAGQISDLSLIWIHLPSLDIELHRVAVSDLSLSWNRLTSLDIRLPKVDARLPNGKDMDLLCRHPALTRLTFRSLRMTFGPGITTLDKLESLTLVESDEECDSSSLLESFFSSFTLPSLKELIISSELGEVSHLDWPPSAFSAFISRSACILTTLSLSNVEISDLNLNAALRLLPSLTELKCDSLWNVDEGPMNNHSFSNPYGGNPVTDHFFSSMHGSSTPPLLPKLRSLSIKTFGTSFDDAMFIDMISSRWVPGGQATIGIDCLRSLVLHFFHRGVDEEVYKPLRQLDEMGMCVVITGRE